jgi:hypothetical protein
MIAPTAPPVVSLTEQQVGLADGMHASAPCWSISRLGGAEDVQVGDRLSPPCPEAKGNRRVASRLFRTLVGGVLWLSDQGVTLLEQFHVQIPFGRPLRGGDVT